MQCPNLYNTRIIPAVIINLKANSQSVNKEWMKTSEFYFLLHNKLIMIVFAGMEPEADSDKEEEPAHLLTTWLGELDTLKKVNN